MSAKLQALWQPFEKSRLQIIDEFSALSNEQLSKLEGEGKWSINQHIYHIYLAEKLGFGYLNKKMQAPEKLIEPGFAGWRRLQTILFFLKYPIKKVKAGGAISAFPEQIEFEPLMEDWANLRGQMKSRYDELGDEFLKKDLFKHPIVGKMNVYHAIKFNNAHLDYHIKSMKRIAKGV